jgi:hypothetical protein
MKKLFILFGLLSLGVFAANTDAKASSVPADSALGGYCCDAYSVRRCVLDYPAPVGIDCFCRGQGYGHVCY